MSSDEPTHTILRGASDAFNAVLDRSLTPLSLKKGQMLFEQGDHDDRLCVLDEGELEVSVLSASGRKLTLNLLQAGAVFGEIAIFDPGPRTATITALAPSTLRVIRQSVLMAELRKDPELALEMAQLAGQRLRWISQQLEEQVFLSAPARLASKLAHLATQGDGSTVRMSQADLADHIGATREAVSKTLSKWRKDGLVDVSRGAITILDEDGLDDAANAEFF